MRFFLQCALTLAVVLPLAASATCLVPAYQATYDLSAGGASGSLVQSLHSTSDHHYTLMNYTKAHVLFFSDTITQRSEGMIRGKSIVPLKYSAVDTHEDKPLNVTFNWQNKTATARYDNKVTTVRHLPASLEDGMSYQLAMSRDLMRGYNKMFNFTVFSQDKNKQPVLKNIVYSAPHKQMLETPMGNLQTYRVMTHDAQAGTVTTLWFAPKYHNVVVKSVTKKGDDVKATLTLKAYKATQACVIAG